MTELRIISGDKEFNPKEDEAFETITAKDWINKQRTLVVFTQGIHGNERKLAKELMKLMCHTKTDSAIIKDEMSEQLSELCKLKNCQNCIFFEQKKQELFVWISKFPEGPSVKFKLSEVALAESNKFHGNCLKGSRPILSFDSEFLKSPENSLIKNLLVDCFNSPKNHPKTQPFFDKVFGFGMEDKKVSVRNYQIAKNGQKFNDFEFVEIGPRFELEVVKIFDGFFTGNVVFLNQNFKKVKDIKEIRNKRIEKKLKSKVLKKERRVKKVENSREPTKKTADEELLD